MPKRILVVAHDLGLNESRVSLLRKAGYIVESVVTDDDAMNLLGMGRFDLVLLGRKSLLPKVGIDQRLREKYPDMLILKIEQASEPRSIYPSRITSSHPRAVLSALRDMLRDNVRLVPLDKG